MPVGSRVAGVVMLAMGAGGALIAAGCAGRPRPTGEVLPANLASAPEWVRDGCGAGAASGATGATICGIGSAAATREPSLAAAKALDRARDEIARLLEPRVRSTLEGYRAAVSDPGESGGVPEAPLVEDLSLQITHEVVSGVGRVDSWVNGGGRVFVLAELDAERFRDAVNEMSDLPDDIRRVVIEGADEAFSRSDEQPERGPDR